MSINALSKGLSAMQGYQRALDVTATNIANAASGANIVPSQAQFSTQASGGVAVTMAPLDVSEGFDLSKDIVNQMQYRNGFELAAKVVQTADDMLGTLVNLDR